jgi:stress-induced-phosphoprotein 1
MLKQKNDQSEMLGETQVLTDFQENPKAAQEHMKNPMVMGRIQKLVSAGIVQVR